MRLLFPILISFSLVGCATKYVVPGNRFITPETQGGVMKGQFEVQSASAHQLTVDVSEGNVENGVTYEKLYRTSYLLSLSLFDQMDLIWTHTGGSNSLIGLKFQLLGDASSAGHKFSLGYAMGGNEHETDDSTSIEFEMTGREILLLYGYRFFENVLAYGTFSYAAYNFEGRIDSPNTAINNLEPSMETTTKGLYGGVEFSYEAFLMKLECGYQQLETTDTKPQKALHYGYSIGLSW